ncbi:MAG: putative GAF sensor [Geobacteraceae bacterium]|nr:MAG: putative GAF sensor [Geobacteraceae bacterium]
MCPSPLPTITKDILDVIDTIYAIDDRIAMFEAFCENMGKLVPISSAAFLPATPLAGNLILQNGLEFNVPEKNLRLFCTYYAPLHPFAMNGQIPELMDRCHNKAISLTDVIPASRLAETEYSRDFQSLHPIFYELGGALGYHGKPVGRFGLHRTRKDRDFSKREKEIVTLLMPHFARALHEFEMKGGNGFRKTGLIMTKADGHPLYMDNEAKRLVKGPPWKTIPIAGHGADTASFLTEEGRYHVRREAAAKSTIFLDLLPVENSLKVKSKLAGFGLSRRQEEIAWLVVLGHSNREISDRLFIAEQTVKDHIYDIFEKIGVRRRSELTAKIMGLRAEGEE